MPPEAPKPKLGKPFTPPVEVKPSSDPPANIATMSDTAKAIWEQAQRGGPMMVDEFDEEDLLGGLISRLPRRIVWNGREIDIRFVQLEYNSYSSSENKYQPHAQPVTRETFPNVRIPANLFKEGILRNGDLAVFWIGKELADKLDELERRPMVEYARQMGRGKRITDRRGADPTEVKMEEEMVVMNRGQLAHIGT